MTSMARSLFAGMTDYTAVPMDVILAHLRNWRDGTSDCIEKLRTFRDEVERCKDRLEQPDAVLRYIGYFIELLSRYHGV
jgi:hypothetical protein